jgi:hypothetical protein
VVLVSEEVLSNTDGHIKINVGQILCRPSAKIHFPVKFPLKSNINCCSFRIFAYCRGNKWH